MRANFNDPGLEYKEDIQSGCEAATHGGFTGVATLPNTEAGNSNQESYRVH